MLIREKRIWDVKSSEITPLKNFYGRRKLLKLALSGIFTISAAGTSHSNYEKKIKKLNPVQSTVGAKYLIHKDTPTNYDAVTQYNNFYEFGTGKSDPYLNSKKFVTKPWTINVSGACENPGVFGFDDLVDLNKLEERVYRFRCVEAWSMVVPWVGLPMANIIDRLMPTSNAKYVSFETLHDPDQMPGQKTPTLDWPYKEGLRIDEAMHPLSFLTVGLYGQILPNQNGAPIRIIIPWKYGFKSIKSIVRIHFQEKMPTTSWALSSPKEYGFYSNVNPNVSHPRWSQARERRIGEFFKRPTLPFNGYKDAVADLYKGMDLKIWY